MELFQLFLLFLTFRRSAPFYGEPWRKESAAKTYGFAELVTKTSVFTGFYERLQLDGLYEFAAYIRSNRIDYKVTKIHYMAVVRDNLVRMIETFAVHSRDHFRRLLAELCGLSMLLIEHFLRGENDEHRPDESDVRAELGLPDDGAYCVITAIDDVGYFVRPVLEVVFLLRAIHGKRQCSLEDLTAEFGRHHRRFAAETLQSTAPPLLQHVSPATAVVVDFNCERAVRRLRAVRREIMQFSKTFCCRWAPFVSHDFLEKTVAEEIRDASRFVRFVHVNEKCLYDVREEVIGVDIIGSPKFTAAELSQWCDPMLESEEYGFKEYEKFVNQKRKVSSKKFVVTKRPPQPRPLGGEEFFSLAELKQLLRSNIRFKNALKYYESVSTVLLMAAVKEGEKIFIGIKLLAQWICSETTGDKPIAKTIRELRFPLSAFKSAFEEFVRLMEREKSTSNEFFEHKIAFADRMSSLMPLLVTRHDDYVPVSRCCDEILFGLKMTDVKGRAPYPEDGNLLSAIKFGEYYFDQPLFHMTQLYRFVAHGSF